MQGKRKAKKITRPYTDFTESFTCTRTARIPRDPSYSCGQRRNRSKTHKSHMLTFALEKRRCSKPRAETSNPHSVLVCKILCVYFCTTLMGILTCLKQNQRLSPKLLACRLSGQLGLSCGKEGTTGFTGLVSEHCDYNPVLQKTFSLSQL